MRPLPVKHELVEEAENYESYYKTDILRSILRNVRSQSLKRLLFLNFILSSRHFYRHPSVGRHVSETYHTYVWEVPLKDIMEILGVNRRTAMDYKCALKWMVSP